MIFVIISLLCYVFLFCYVIYQKDYTIFYSIKKIGITNHGKELDLAVFFLEVPHLSNQAFL